MGEFDSVFENCLFRYRSITDSGLEALANNRLYFSTPINDFNDPYDNLVFADSNRIVSDIISNIECGMDNYLDSKKEESFQKAFIFWQQLDKSNQRSKVLNGYEGRIYNLVDTIKKVIRYNSKILCFSEVYDSMLMWSHYADYHRGYSLIYDKNELADAPCFDLEDSKLKNCTRLKKIEYVSKQTDLTQDIEDYIRYEVLENMGDVEKKDGNIPQIKLLQSAIEKSNEWEYEKEWRLIPRIINTDKPSPLGYIECKPRGIILGVHCTDENRERIISIGKRNQINIYQMFLDEINPTFKLHVGEGENAHIC